MTNVGRLLEVTTKEVRAIGGEEESEVVGHTFQRISVTLMAARIATVDEVVDGIQESEL